MVNLSNVTLATTNNTNVGIPSVGVAGGIGDKLIFYAGTSTVYPYSLYMQTRYGILLHLVQVINIIIME